MIDLTFVILIIVGAIVLVSFLKYKDRKMEEFMYCEKCGTQNNKNSKFCDNCGTPIGDGENNRISNYSLKRSKSSNSGWGWLITIVGIITFFVSLLLRGTTEYGYGQYPWMAQASFASNVDLAFNISILLIAVGLVLVIVSHIKKS